MREGWEGAGVGLELFMRTVLGIWLRFEWTFEGLSERLKPFFAAA